MVFEFRCLHQIVTMRAFSCHLAKVLNVVLHHRFVLEEFILGTAILALVDDLMLAAGIGFQGDRLAFCESVLFIACFGFVFGEDISS
jgi:hypothetical protein